MRDANAQTILQQIPNIVAQLDPEKFAAGKHAFDWTERLLLVGGIAVGTVAIISLAAWLFHKRSWDWRLFGATVGGLVGVILGLVVYARVPLATQYFMLGALTGMGADGLVALVNRTGGATVVQSLSNWIANLVVAALGAGVPATAARPITVGAWSMILMLCLVVVIGFFDPLAH